MSGDAALLAVRDLRTYFRTESGEARAVDGVSFDIRRGETLGIVGESGSGKSVTALSILRLVPDPPGRIEPGSSIRYAGRDLLALSESAMRSVRGNDIAMVFQEPMTSLNPVFTAGDQVAEAIRLHRRTGKAEAWQRALELLSLVGLPAPTRAAQAWPHQLSGGQRQRVMIAMALACDPGLFIADEPTTALDVTIQAQILELLRELQQRLGMGLLLITHDLGVAARVSDRVAVLYAGRIVEHGDVRRIFEDPRHPYTQGLLRAMPRIDTPVGRLDAIPGQVPAANAWPEGCRFHPRCARAWEPCRAGEPDLFPLPGDGASRCWLERHPERP